MCIYWRTVGNKKTNLVLLHGWGLNSEVWSNIVPILSKQFCLHLVDLPGYGRSISTGMVSLLQIIEMLLDKAPNKAIWVGWSLGGLIASKIALQYPNRVQGLITIASSPFFIATKDWPGVSLIKLKKLQKQLEYNYSHVVEQFIATQVVKTHNERKVQDFKKAILSQPCPSFEVLNQGLEFLKTEDIRKPMCKLKPAFLRIYGYFDNLVPRQIVNLLDNYWPNSKSMIINKAAHAPFISHPEQFCQNLLWFTNKLNTDYRFHSVIR